MIRSIVRAYVRTPALSLAAIACVLVGTAATTAVSTLAAAVLWHPVPFKDASRLVRIWLEEPGVDRHFAFSIPETRDLRRVLTTADLVLATARMRIVALYPSGAERMRGEGVDREYFDALGLHPSAGRLFADSDFRADAPAVMVISEGTRQRYFGNSDPIGTLIRTQQGSYTIVGVGPAAFQGTVEDDVVEFWTPITQYEPRSLITNPAAHPSWVIARLKAGASAEALNAEIQPLFQQWRAAAPDRYRQRAIYAEPFGESWRGGYRRGTALLGAAAILLLAVAALNVGCLLVARVLDRRRELIVRTALGATRGRITTQLLAEAVTVVLAGGIPGVLLGRPLLTRLLATSPVALPAYLQLQPDGRTALLALLALTICAVLAGVIPMMLVRDLDAGDALRSGSRGSVGHSGSRWTTTLIAIEIAVTLTLLCGGALLLRSFERQNSLPLGYPRQGIARLAITFSDTDLPSVRQQSALLDRLRTAIANVPGAAATAMVAPPLPPWDAERGRVFIDTPPDAEGGMPSGVHHIDGALLPTLGIRVVSGRNLRDDDPANVAMVSRALATRMGGPERAIGRSFQVVDRYALPTPYRIVGVADNVAYDGFVEQDTRRSLQDSGTGDLRSGRADIYLPLRATGIDTVSVAVVTPGEAAAMIEPVRRAIASVAPTSAVHWTGTMAEEVAVEYAPARFYAILIAAFSSSALLLTSIGLFALVWNETARRTREIGLRQALGASPARIAMGVLGLGLKPLAFGIVAGSVAAAWSAEFIGHFLYDTSATDPLALGLATVVLLTVVLAACALPARRAIKIEPLAALKID